MINIIDKSGFNLYWKEKDSLSCLIQLSGYESIY